MSGPHEGWGGLGAGWFLGPMTPEALQTLPSKEGPCTWLKDVFSIFFFFPRFLGPHPQHMEVPRLGV